jgi:hypothetical protein
MVKSDFNQICHMVHFADMSWHGRSNETPLQVASSDTTSSSNENEDCETIKV